MPHDEDAARRAARERLQARMDRRSRSGDAAQGLVRSGAQRRPSGAKPAGDGRPAPRGGGGKALSAQAGGRAVLARFSNPLVPLAIAAGAFLLVFAVAIPHCTGPAGGTSAGSAGQATQGQAASALESYQRDDASRLSIPDSANAQHQALVSLIGEEETVKLLGQARTDRDALWIAAHPDAYAPEGTEVQAKMLKLAADEPAAVPFVREYPEAYPLEAPSNDASLALSSTSPASTVADTAIPHFYQWDRRWGNTVYSSASFGLTGCGPTSLAMVCAGLTGNAQITPYDMGVLARERNYMATYDGTANTFFTEMAGELGLFCEEVYPTADNITSALAGGQVLIVNLAPGYFTQHGHFFVLAGLADDGGVIVNDPYSVVRSSQTWDAELIASESRAAYAYSTW